MCQICILTPTNVLIAPTYSNVAIIARMYMLYCVTMTYEDVSQWPTKMCHTTVAIPHYHTYLCALIICTTKITSTVLQYVSDDRMGMHTLGIWLYRWGVQRNQTKFDKCLGTRMWLFVNINTSSPSITDLISWFYIWKCTRTPSLIGRVQCMTVVVRVYT